jgi:hypothetical protein
VKAQSLLSKLNETRELTVAQKLLLKMEGVDPEAPKSVLLKLNQELTLKQSGSTFVFPQGTLVAFIGPNKKGRFSTTNSNNTTEVDALTGTTSPTVFKKVMKVSKDLGDVPSNKNLIKKEFNKVMIGHGQIADLIK